MTVRARSDQIAQGTEIAPPRVEPAGRNDRSKVLVVLVRTLFCHPGAGRGPLVNHSCTGTMDTGLRR
jgi:hypothetical protein